MYQSEKPKSLKSSSQKEQTQETKWWDHPRFDQVQQHEKNGNNEKSKNSQKSSNKQQKQGQDDQSNKGSSFRNTNNSSNAPKWSHDKYEETLKSESEGNKRKDQKRARKEKKPDRQLYNVRRKQEKEDPAALDINEEGRQGYPNYIEENMRPFDYDNNIVSNSSNGNVKGSSNEDENEETIKIVLKTDSGTIDIKLSENEQDFEKVLSEICKSSGISGRMELCLKINMLQSLQSLLKVPHQNLNSYLDDLLMENYNQIISEMNSGEPSDILSRYFEDEDSQDISEYGFQYDSIIDYPMVHDFTNSIEI